MTLRKLTDEQVEEIRRKHFEEKETVKKLAVIYNVSEWCITGALSDETKRKRREANKAWIKNNKAKFLRSITLCNVRKLIRSGDLTKEDLISEIDKVSG